MPVERQQVAIVTGGSAGLGVHIAREFLHAGYRVAIVGRSEERLASAAKLLKADDGSLMKFSCDLTQPESIADLMHSVNEALGGLDVLVNCAGASDRGLVENLSAQSLHQLIDQNVTTAMLCAQAAIESLEKTGGVIINIGSLAGKVGARYIGGYAAAKHALSGLTQQMRLELKPRGVHVGLVSPGPIRREDEGSRYQEKIDASVPEQASRPGGGTSVKGLAPETVARAVLKSVKRRRADVVLPGYLRILIAVGNAFPRIGDWLLLKLTSGK